MLIKFNLRKKFYICKLICALLLFLSIEVQDSEAGWGYTDWTMTAEEVVLSSQGKAFKLETPIKMSSGLIKLVSSNYKIDQQLSCAVSFLFDPNSNLLDCVVLKLQNSKKGSDLYAKLVKQYGKPYSKDFKLITGGKIKILKWQDINKNNEICFFNRKKKYQVEYRPIKREIPGL